MCIRDRDYTTDQFPPVFISDGNSGSFESQGKDLANHLLSLSLIHICVKLQYLEELLNIHIDMQAVPAASYEDKKKVLISTDQKPDIMKISPIERCV